MNSRHAPHAIDLFCGLGGWTEGLLAAGWDVTGYDIEAHEYDGERYPAKLMLADVLMLDGAQFADADLIVASPPCQEYSYMAMPWRRAKQIARALRGEGDFPDGYRGSRTIPELTALFDASFRIQREACAAAGRHIPLVVENVRGAEPWVGRARHVFGSYYLWGDVPALMPAPSKARKFNPDRIDHATKNTGGSWFNVAHNTTSGVGNNPDGRKNPGFRFDGSGRSFQTESVDRHVAPTEGFKSRGMNWSDPVKRGQDFTRIAGAQAVEGRKQPGIGGPRANGKGDAWFQDGAAAHGSRSSARKAASARIAKIPFALSHWIARAWLPVSPELIDG